YYAMQYIEGHTLAALIYELRRLAGLELVADPGAFPTISESAGAPAFGEGMPPKRGAPELPATVPYAGGLPASMRGGASTQAAAALATIRSTNNPSFFRTAAQLGIQAAGALEHAHDMGVVHR